MEEDRETLIEKYNFSTTVIFHSANIYWASVVFRHYSKYWGFSIELISKLSYILGGKNSILCQGVIDTIKKNNSAG